MYDLRTSYQAHMLNIEKLVAYDHAIMVHKVLKEMCTENFKGKFCEENSGLVE